MTGLGSGTGVLGDKVLEIIVSSARRLYRGF